MTPLASGDGEVTSLMERFNNAVAAHPDVKRPQIMLLMHTFVADSVDDATRLEQDLSAFYCTFGAWFQNKRPIRQGFIDPLSEAEMAAMPNFSPQAMAKNLVIGRPEQVIQRLKSYEALGYDQYSIWIDSGISHARKKRSLELFIRHVMPAFV